MLGHCWYWLTGEGQPWQYQFHVTRTSGQVAGPASGYPLLLRTGLLAGFAALMPSPDPSALTCQTCCHAEQVVVAPWRPELPDWADYAAHPEWVARTKRWAGGKICADRWSGGGRRGAPLLQQLQSRTALACMVCDPGGQVPFQRREQLLMHVEQEHGMGLCSLCLGVSWGARSRAGAACWVECMAGVGSGANTCLGCMGHVKLCTPESLQPVPS